MAPSNRDADPDDLPDADVDARWSDIVARLGDVEESERSITAAPVTPEPATPEPDTGPDQGPEAEPRAVGPRDWPASPEVEALEEAEEHFVPPEPEPVAHRDPLLTLAWTVVVAVPVLTVLGVVLRAMLSSLSVPGWLGPAAGGAFLAAIAVLLWRMPHRRDPDDHDPGAVV